MNTVKRALFILMTLLSYQAVAATHASESLDRIVAVLNDTVITQSELQESINTVKKQITASHMSLPTENILRKQVLDQLINRKLQLDLAEQAHISVTNAEVDAAIAGIAKDHNVSVAELYQKINEQGLTKAEYHKQIQEEMTLQRVQQQNIGARLNVSPKEIDDFMHSKDWQAYSKKEYHIEDILVGIPEEPTSQQISAAKAQADKIMTKLHQGVNFRQAAMSDSTNANALQGGDLGWRKLPEVPSAFSEKIIRMKADDIAGPIQTPNGFHIIHLAGTRDVSGMSAANERKQVEQLIFQRKVEEALQNWITRLRSSAYVDLNPDNSV